MSCKYLERIEIAHLWVPSWAHNALNFEPNGKDTVAILLLASSPLQRSAPFGILIKKDFYHRRWVMSIAWVFLILAGFFEICFTISLKYSQGFSKIMPSIITVIFIVLSFFSVAQSMKTIPIGTAYAVWAGIGAAGTVTCGMIFFGDSYHIIRLLSIVLIIIGIIGLKLAHVD